MDRSRYAINPGIILDARRAVWLENERVLAVADLHLGYAWAHRYNGQMMPVSAHDDTVARLVKLVADYSPREVAFLGDIVHRAVPVPALEEELRRVWHEVGGRTALRWISGNHDAHLGPMLRRIGVPAELLPAHRAGRHLLVHGDSSEEEASVHREIARVACGRILIGHEHPAIALGDGVTALKCPCFLASHDVVVLPAFSQWAAGTDVRQHNFMSPLAKDSGFTHAIAIMANKLLPLPL